MNFLSPDHLTSQKDEYPEKIILIDSLVKHQECSMHIKQIITKMINEQVTINVQANYIGTY